jgi:hypothetical protein
MNVPHRFSLTVNGKPYNVDKATLIASNLYWNGNSFEQNGRNTFLYKTFDGRFFIITLTQLADEENELIPVSVDEAIVLYRDELKSRYVKLEAAFCDKVI